MAKKINLNKENNEKLALKRAGHSLIDRIKWKGYSKDQVYSLLSKELGREERHAHFGAMNTLRELRPAVEALERLFKKLPNTQYAFTHRRKLKEQRCPIVLDIPVAKAIKLAGVKPKESKKWDSKADTLPRAEVLRALEEMKRDRLLKQEGAATLQNDRFQLKGGLYVYVKKLLRL